MLPIQIKTNERILIVGKTGSGKTYLAKYLTRQANRLVVLDAKATLTDWNLDPWDSVSRGKLLSHEPIRIRVLPPYDGDITEYWEAVLSDCYKAGNVVIYIDELYSICPPNQKPMNVLWSMYTRGRELGIGVWSSSQRPAWIPLFALSEAEHFFNFRLQLDEDRKRMAVFMGAEVLTNEHGFYYSKAIWDRPQFYTSLVVNQTPTYVKNTVVAPPEKLDRTNRLRTIPIFRPVGGK
jgi:energy-coupling factor transporter ATP-binding protein EcfA2